MPNCPHPVDFIKSIVNPDGSVDHQCDICGDVIAHDPPEGWDSNYTSGHEHWENT